MSAPTITRRSLHQWQLWAGLVALFLVGQAITKTLFDRSWEPLLLGDSGRYLDAATRFPHLRNEEPGYAGYIFVMWLGEQLGSVTWFVLAVQSAAVIAAAAALWDVARRFGNGLTGWLAAAFYLLNPLIAQWSGAVLTEAMYYASVIGTGWALARRFDHGIGRTWPVIALASAAFLMRPNGIVFLAAVVALIGWLHFPGLSRQLAWVGGTFILLGISAFTLPYLTSGGGGEDNAFGPRAWAGEVFWGSDEWQLSMPVPDDMNPSNAAFMRYAVANPIDMTKLAVARAGWEAVQVRPWYSTSLNLFAAASTAVLVAFGCLGFRRLRASAFSKLTIVTTVTSLGLIGLTWAIHEGRFGWWFYVLWIVWASVGIEPFVRRLTSRLTSIGVAR